MKNTVLRSLQVAVAAAALGLGGFAAAQPAAGQQGHGQNMHKKGHHKHHRGERGQGGRDVSDGSSNAKEAAAARQADRQGQLSGRSGDQYANNAVARCAVFKMEEDKRACADRVSKGQDSGSVQGGGILREYRYEVPAK